MKRVYSLLGFVAAFLVAASAAHAGLAAVPSYTNQEIKVFRNVSGSTLNHGDAVVFQTRNNDTNIVISEDGQSDQTIGLDVTTTTSADSRLFAGCMLSRTCADDALCHVVVAGPALCRWAGSTDNTNTRGAAVGTTTVAGRLGSGSFAGSLLTITVNGDDSEINGATDSEVRWIWLGPGGS